MQVRYRQNMGRVTNSGLAKHMQLIEYRRTINLTKNSQFYVRQADVERLIAQGYLQKLS